MQWIFQHPILSLEVDMHIHVSQDIYWYILIISKDPALTGHYNGKHLGQLC